MNRRIACQPIQIRTECGKKSTGVFLGNSQIIDLIRPAPDDYQLEADSKIRISVFRDGWVEELSVTVSEPHFRTGTDESAESIPILNVIVNGRFEPGDSGAPAIVEYEGSPYLLGTLNFGEIILFGQTEDLVRFGSS